MSKTINYYLSILVLICSKEFIPPCQALFEYICEEKQLFKPYVHVYRGRKGERVLESGPGFHVMTQEQDIYVCINGPAYLYFARTTALGQVYEAPQTHVYSHTCEMYNVKPHSKATKIDYELHLMAVLLFGDQEDYRLPAIQRFTAPYFFDQDEYLTGFPKHYQNATSIAVIGESECVLEKGDKDPKIPIIIQPKPEVSEPPPEPGDKPEKDGFICRLGFSDKLKTDAKDKPDDDAAKQTMRLMVNDEPIRVLHCDAPYTFDKAKFEIEKSSLQNKSKALKDLWEPKFEETTKVFNEAVDAQLKLYKDEMEAIDAKLSSTSTSKSMIVQLMKKKKILEAKTELEEKKKLELEKLVVKAKAALAEGEQLFKAVDELVSEAEKTATALADLNEKLKELETATPPDPKLIMEQKGEIYTAENIAFKAAKDVSQALSQAGLNTDKAEVLIAEVVAKAVYTVSKIPSTKPKITYSERTIPEKIIIPNEDCEKLPRLTGEQGECKKGKPDKAKACDLFKVTLGKTDVWTPPEAEDNWKKDILDLVGGIFVNACPYLSNRRKFVKLINRVLGYYLTSDNHFNKPSTAGTSDSCRAFHGWKKNQTAKPPFPPGPGPPPGSNKPQREFWKTIVEVLTDCESAKRSLTFVNTSPSFGKWVWVKPDVNKTEMTIEPYREQAEKEYVFNWVIDMAWRVFATALGICMPGYEDKIPLITSRFYSMFTEDFLIPLRETWINSKDNLVFQWILGEFYNGDAEDWSELCMEASYFYSEREDYRPLRGLLVNCASEHNYFITGKFVGYSGKYVGLGK